MEARRLIAGSVSAPSSMGVKCSAACYRLLFFNRQAGVDPGVVAAEQRADVRDVLALQCLRRTGA